MAYSRGILNNGDDGTYAVPDTTENAKYKARKTAGIPKMNFHVYGITADNTNVSDTSTWIYMGGFKEADGLNATIEQSDYSDTTTRNVIIKNPGKITYDNITLKKGFDSDTACRQWHLQRGSAITQSDRYMLDLVILKMTQDTSAVARAFLIRNAWVSGYNPESMDDTSTDVWLEDLTLAHDGWMMGNVFAAVNASTDKATLIASPASATFGTNTYVTASAYAFDYWRDPVTGIYDIVTPEIFFRQQNATDLAE